MISIVGRIFSMKTRAARAALVAELAQVLVRVLVLGLVLAPVLAPVLVLAQVQVLVLAQVPEQAPDRMTKAGGGPLIMASMRTPSNISTARTSPT